MGVITWLAQKLNPATPAPQQRAYAGARLDRLSTAFGFGGNQSVDAGLRFALPTLRNRSRDLAENNDYIAGYLELLGNKVIGATGIRLQVKSRGGDGKLDREANNAIESAWKAWGKKGICDVTGKLSWVELQRLSLISMARDGEVFIRIVKQLRINKFNFALQLIEADQVDINKNDILSNGNIIRMGVELNQWGKPVAYHVFETHPGDINLGAGTQFKTIRISADEMIHLYRQLRPGQTRGVPWTAAVMTRLHHMGAYEEAAIINARFGASKMGFYTKNAGAGDLPSDGKDESGNLISEVEPGQLEVLPEGYDIKTFDPTYPSNEYDPFIKRQVKGASCGLPGATYSDLSNDLESVNFSSIRQGTLNARDSYRALQQLMIDILCIPIYELWLGQSLDFGLLVIISNKRGPNVTLPAGNYDKYNTPLFVGRGWDWVDPLKDQKANSEALLNNLTTRTRIAAECGEDFEEILAERAQENELAESFGISLDPLPTTQTTGDTNNANANP
ncbi:MAG: phage portal protein [Desulfuromonadaceae bacterium]|nr:phage portal protein [Desulfuromonadaceae bacterium]MDD2856279.1 phage portal protein [Desulfuromonadaceae bacterium]